MPLDDRTQGEASAMTGDELPSRRRSDVARGAAATPGRNPGRSSRSSPKAGRGKDAPGRSGRKGDKPAPVADVPSRAGTTGRGSDSAGRATANLGRAAGKLGRAAGNAGRAGGGPGRAGRNLNAAIGVGVGLGALVIGSLLLDPRAFLVVLLVAVGLGAWEMTRAVAAGGIGVTVVPVLVGVISMNVAAFFRGGEALILTYGLTVLAILIWRVADGAQHALGDIAGSVLVATYPGFLAGFASMLLSAEDGVQRILFFIAVTVAYDIGGYAVGVAIGRHPMAPTVSPKKSWEGFGGSLALSALVSGGLIVWFFDAPFTTGLLVGAAVAAVATLGDLVESLIKRDLGLKDMGTLLPGHGGFMDRLDSLVLTAPVVWAFLTVVSGTG